MRPLACRLHEIIALDALTAGMVVSKELKITGKEQKAVGLRHVIREQTFVTTMHTVSVYQLQIT
jgi:hypothetical protein